MRRKCHLDRMPYFNVKQLDLSLRQKDKAKSGSSWEVSNRHLYWFQSLYGFNESFISLVCNDLHGLINFAVSVTTGEKTFQWNVAGLVVDIRKVPSVFINQFVSPNFLPLFYLHWHKFLRHVISRLWRFVWRKHVWTNQNS